MAHNHTHSHAETTKLTEVNRAFLIGIVLNLLFVLVQVVVGFNINSLSLLSDAGHNFLDVAGLALSLLAFKLNNVKSVSINTDFSELLILSDEKLNKTSLENALSKDKKYQLKEIKN